MERLTLTKYFRYCRPELAAEVPLSAKRILDVGCSAGALGAHLRQRQGCEVWGVEADPFAAREAAQALDHLIAAPIEAALEQLPKQYFDVLIVADVLEHLPDPWLILNQLTEALAPSATVVLSLPNVQHHSILTGLQHGSFTYLTEGVLDATHLRFFTRTSMIELAERAGLRVEKMVPLYSTGRDRRAAQRGHPPRQLSLPPSVPLRDVYAWQFVMVAHLPEARPDTRPVRVSIVMLTFNRLDVTRQAIDSIRNAASRQPYELILVDNASTDGTREYLREIEGPDTLVLLNDENLGVAAGWNQGLRLASGDCLMVINNDVLVAGDWLERLVRAAYHVPNAGIVSCRTNFAGGPQVLTPDYDGLADFAMFATRYAVLSDRSWFELPRLVGVVLLWRRDVYDKLGGFDESFFPANFEDDDYCLRATQAGFRNVVANDVYVHHIGHASQISNRLDPDRLLSDSDKRFRAKWGEAAATHTASQWGNFEQHVATLETSQYSLPGWALPRLPRVAIANHLARAARRMNKRGWRDSARQLLRRSLRTKVTFRGLWGWLEATLLPRRTHE